VKQAGDTSSLVHSTDVPQAIRDAVSPDGPSPASPFVDDMHCKVMLINARRKYVDFTVLFGMDFLHLVKSSIRSQEPVCHSQSGPKGYSLSKTHGAVKPGQYAYRRSGCNAESLTNATATFTSRLEENIYMKPEGQHHRQHHHMVTCI